MNGVFSVPDIQQRLLTFELADSIYAIPIACIVEVSEVEPLACVPTLRTEIAAQAARPISRRRAPPRAS